MKIKNVLVLVFLFLGMSLGFAQKVTYANKEYKIKGDKIFLDGEDVSAQFNEEEKLAIFEKLKVQKEKEKAAKKEEKAKKKEEKELKKKEKEQKKREKELKKKEDAQKDYNDAVEKLDKAQAKYDKLKRKGKLSPNDEVKWLDKLAKLKEKVAKKKRKL